MPTVTATCTIDGCEKAAHARGWCRTHYARWQRNGSTDVTVRPFRLEPTECAVEGCVKLVVARQWCRTHYVRWQRTGSASPATPLRAWGSATERFWKSINKGTVKDCWHWTGYVKPNGYAQMRVDGSWVYAHRFAYALLKGPIPDDMTVDHECHNRDASCKDGATCMHRRCCNPNHLGLATQADNWRLSKNNSHLD